MLKKLITRLPIRVRQSLKRYVHGRQIRNRSFHGGEPEFDRLSEWVKPGDWAIDLGANIGHYTYRLSELAGPAGRVVAFEPVPQTFELLAANVARFRYGNVTLVNAAASCEADIVHMDLPEGNFYRAAISDHGSVSALALPVDSLGLTHPISLIKLDVEGHEYAALLGTMDIIRRDKPLLIVEHSGNFAAVEHLLLSLGYAWTNDPASPNRVYMPKKATTAGEKVVKPNAAAGAN